MREDMRDSSAPAADDAGEPLLGAHVRPAGTSFALWAPRATRVELALMGEDRRQVNVDLQPCGNDGRWAAFVPGVGSGHRYGYRVHGPWAPREGVRFNPAKLLLDPYARAITSGVHYSGPIRDHTAASDDEADHRDSSGSVPLSVVVADSPPPAPLARPVPLADTVLYELHVKGYTQLHPAVPEHLRGTYAGLAYPAVLEHLLDLGVTSVELLPVHHFVSEPFLIGRGLSNFWGYNTLGFFAPHAAYCSVGTLGQQVQEFKEMVSAFHAAGLEVILDVVYNHTGEGGHEGPTLAFRGIDHGSYYRLTDHRSDYDVTGCGNSLDTSEPGVLAMVLDSLRYWVSEMGVDGFRFDLATTLFRDREHAVDLEHHPLAEALRRDPVLSRTKLIAEPWDLGPHGYQVGAFPGAWSEWNDRFRNYIRDFWRGHTQGVSELAVRLAGSPDIFDRGGRRSGSSVNFITAHDGFTLRDLVSYHSKHNQANGEANRDGTDDNRSTNCGVEGESTDPEVKARRQRQAQNLMATLLVSAGLPMITAGDELGRTQAGNNNAYCQDSPISWVHWDTAAEWSELSDLTASLLELRAEHPVFRRTAFAHGEELRDARGNLTGRKNLAWFGGGAHEMTVEEWADSHRRTLGMYIAYDAAQRDHDEGYLIWIHGGNEPIEVHLPNGAWADTYTVVAHSGSDGDLPGEKLLSGTSLVLPARTVAVLQVD
jgi:glycogen debranching enzyme